MSFPGRSAGIAAALVMGAALIGASFSYGAPAAKPKKPTTPQEFSTGIDDSGLRSASSAESALARAAGARVSYIRISASWRGIAPTGSIRPAGFDARSPADPLYSWTSVDAQVRRAIGAGFTPYISLFNAPDWAQSGKAPAGSGAGDGAWKPSATEFGEFARAAAIRYSGSYVDATSGGILPRVSIWQAWNEPNLPLFLAPSSPTLYRDLLNAMHDAVKAVQPAATIVTAGLAPVKSSAAAAFPKEFAEELLCVTPSGGWFEKANACPEARFDVLALHPYSLKAKPTQRARIAGNMFVADALDVAQALKAAQNANSIKPGVKRLWVTEFAWFTTPANPSVGDAPSVAGRRTSIALYLLWRAGISHVTWFALSDNSESIVKGGGLFDSSGRPKPTYYALRFPFFVRQQGRGLLVWGRAPAGGDGAVSIKVRRNGSYRELTTVTPAANGVFKRHLTIKSRRAGRYLAEQKGDRSLALGSREFYR